MIRYLLVIACIMKCFTINAQPVADTGKRSLVTTMSYAQVQAYLKGDALNDMARLAEINHFPMPDKVLKFKKELDLSPIQVKKIGDINLRMHKLRVQNGQFIVRNERTLDSLFKTGKIDNGNLIFFGNRYGAYQAEIRIAILQACMSTQQELTPYQITRFEALQKAN